MAFTELAEAAVRAGEVAEVVLAAGVGAAVAVDLAAEEHQENGEFRFSQLG